MVYSGLLSAAARHGLAKHHDKLGAADQITIMKLIAVADFFIVSALALSKTSFAFTLLKLAGGPWQQRFIWFIVVTGNAVMWFVAITPFITCRPPERWWNKNIPGTCWPDVVVKNLAILAGAYSASMDLVLAMLPIAILWKLRVIAREKLQLCAAMSLYLLWVLFPQAWPLLML